MRIGIDAKFLTHPQKGGFKTYTENLISAISKFDSENEYVLYVDRPPSSDTQIPDSPNFSYKVISGGRSFYGMPWREQVVLSRQLGIDKLDLFHAPCLTAPLFVDIPFVVTIHDTIWFYPARYSADKTTRLGKRKFMVWYYQFVPSAAIKKAQGIITVSNAAKKNIVRYLHVREDRIFVTHEAANEMYHPVNDIKVVKYVVSKYRLDSKYILGIGSADRRKNLKTLVQAYALLPESVRNSHQLAIVWTHNSLASELLVEAKSLGISNRIVFLEDVSDQDLLLLYNGATAFVFPSLEEGFGLPLLEAMACGAPVLAANNSSIPEIVGDAALTFSAENANELASSLVRVVTDQTLQTSLRERGIERAATFSWRKCGYETLDIYNQMVRR